MREAKIFPYGVCANPSTLTDVSALVNDVIEDAVKNCRKTDRKGLAALTKEATALTASQMRNDEASQGSSESSR